MLENSAQIHLYLNHFSIVGTIFVLLIVIISMLKKSEAVFFTALILMVMVGLITIPVYNSGDGAAQIVKGLEGTNEEFIKIHEEAALYAMIATQLTAVVALAGLIFFRKKHVYPGRFKIFFIVLLLVSTVTLVRTGHLGGKIKHEEIHSDFGS